MLPHSLGAEEPLRQYGKLRTSDADQAQDVVARVYEPHTLIPSAHSTLDARMNAVQCGTITIGYLTYGTGARIGLPHNDRWYHVNVPLRGTSRVTRADGVEAATAGLRGAAILLPHHDQVIQWERDTAQLALRIPRESLEEHAAVINGSRVTGPLDFATHVDLTTPQGRSLVNALAFATSEWDHGGVLATHAPSRRHLEHLLLTSLLGAARGAYNELETQRGRTPGLRAAQQAKTFIEEHLTELPTLQDVLQAVQVSARTLQVQFQALEGCTASEYLKKRRLEAARQSLLAPASPSVTVSTVATSWGFYHLGRFSSDYRRLFGEFPSETLHRSRRLLG